MIGFLPKELAHGIAPVCVGNKLCWMYAIGYREGLNRQEIAKKYGYFYCYSCCEIIPKTLEPGWGQDKIYCVMCQ